MKCPRCQFVQANGLVECSKCGIVFAKYGQPSRMRRRSESKTKNKGNESVTAIKALLLPSPIAINPLILGGRMLLLCLLSLWSLKFIFSSIESNYAGQAFLHLVNLPFHEAGHIIFSPFGRLIQAFGGTLGQLLMPTICMLVLLIQTRDAFGAAIATWWMAENFMDIAPYINDARALNLVLLGGVTGKDVEDYHDWEFILRKLGLLHMDHALATAAQTLGIVLMITALAWALMNLWVQFRSYHPESIETR